MNDVAELKRFVSVHAEAQGLRPSDYRPVLGRIRDDADDSPTSWAAVWSAAGERLEERGRLLEACRHYTMARFPFVDGPARRRAQDRCVQVFDQWRRGLPGVEPLEIGAGDERFRAWATGLSAAEPRPLLIITGGVISTKEQWAPTMRFADRLGLAVVVTEMPGVGENTSGYSRESWRLYPAVMDAVADRARADQTIALALSFSGHLALRCATKDARVRAVVTAGAPIREFFTDQAWQRRLPRVTVDTLTHLTGAPADTLLHEELPSWALDDSELAALDIPVRYLASLRDEVIPPMDLALLRQHVRDLHVLEHDDVHGSPGHVLESRLWIVESLLRLSGDHGLRPRLLAGLRRGVGRRRRLVSRAGSASRAAR
ncbi:alpha/beta hydrolase [Frankia sp. AgB1.9]|uniref:alpha/beta hydrolase n=1 Tax=unclassified Frankia TaxID=2632575 RepID=UPI001931E686|nr:MULTISPECIES: alpha/beta hydrolase [unclassified Frankia]MBL7491583.1 alpha/beta hydrolase [Frankia sp. AgW1.1]MBL7553171.1 alpha/beta hydrolase [Frankia sp. AgB1.9]MBL7624591.1 alpha/beta hydrolase [Frankia sp. AgB1.8]